MYLGVASNSQVKEDDLKLLILLPLPPEYLDCKHVTITPGFTDCDGLTQGFEQTFYILSYSFKHMQ